jgi:hypothetical protein
MTEKMLIAIEAALWRVLDACLKRADAMYPDRGTVDSEYLLHLRCVQSVMGWHETQMMGLYKMRLAARPRRPMPPRRSSSWTDDLDDWDCVLELFGSPRTSWMMSIGLSALPYDIRLLLVQMNFIIELAMTDAVRCLSELQVMADSLDSERRSMGGKSLAPSPAQARDRQQHLERESKALADRFKKLLGPKPVLPSQKSPRP